MFQAVVPQKLRAGGHSDTYGIALPRDLSIHSVSDARDTFVYDCGMADTSQPWLDWGARFRRMIKDKGLSLAQIGERMTPQRAESSLRSWTNDTRRVNLEEFFALCAAAELDPAVVLFARPVMTDRQHDAINTLVTEKMREPDPKAGLIASAPLDLKS